MNGLQRNALVPWKTGLILDLSPGNRRTVGSPWDHSWPKINCVGGRDPRRMDYETSVHPKCHRAIRIGLVGLQGITFQSCLLLTL